MTVRIGTVSLERVLDWEGEEEITIPVKRIVRKTSCGTSQSDYPTRTPRRIHLTVKVTATKKIEIRNLKNQAVWQELYDYDDTFVDWVWIEALRPRWARERDSDFPWQIRIDLLCSTT